MSLRAILAGTLAASLGLAARVQARSSEEAEVIYGNDDRKELFDPTNDPALIEAARSTAALIYQSQIKPLEGDSLHRELDSASFGDVYKLCATEPFRDQPNPAFCSGFLVADDLLVTAGHCVESQENCQTIAFVFGFGYESEGQQVLQPLKTDIYGCKQLLARSYETASKSDFALVQLDRKVPQRTPLPFRQKQAIETGAALTLIGYPAGIPVKISSGAAVRSNDATAYFVTNTDSYGGNSGSPVLNNLTHEVEGILVRGEEDFVDKGGCRVSNRCQDDDCRGEEVTRAAEFAPFVADALAPDVPTIDYTYGKSDLNLAIPDDSQQGVAATLEVTTDGVLRAISLHIALRHTYRNDLVITLIHPDGTAIVLQANQGGGLHDLDATYGDGGIMVSSLIKLRGKKAAGTWKVLVQDTSKTDTGTLDAVTLTTKVLVP